MPPDNWLYGSISIKNWLYSCLSPRTTGYIVAFPRDNYKMVVLSQKTSYLVVCPSNIGYIVTVPTEIWLYGSIQLKTDYIHVVVYPPENWLPLYSSLSPIHLLNGSPISENWLYISISPLNWLYYYTSYH